MREICIVGLIINIVYLIIWFSVIKIRNSQCKIIKDFDNGNEFYESLNDSYKESYWKEDTKILNMFFLLLLVFIEISLFFLLKTNNLWILSLILGLVISSIIAIILSIKLKRKYK